MKKIERALIIAVILTAWLLGNGSLPVQAQGNTPTISPFPPQPAVSAPVESDLQASALTTTALNTIPLKAVLIVGPIDGDNGSWTEQEKANMELAAQFLEAQGVTVHRFYTPNNNWEEIKTAAEGAHFLLYRGHGVYWPSVPDYGGFYLKSGFVQPSQISQDLHLAPNAIVMLYACYAAGTSGSDTTDIGLTEAQYRVARYSEPFLDLGIAGYYANWFGNAFEKFLTHLFAGKTLGQAYESYFDFNAATVSRTTHPTYPQAQMWIDKDNWRGYWEYNNAFVGQPDATLETLFPPQEPELGGLPQSVTFTYSLADGQFRPAAYTIQPQNITTDDPITWNLAVDGSWFTVSQENGETPQPFVVTPEVETIQALQQNTITTSSGYITVQAIVNGQTETRQIQVNLQVVEKFYETYLPLVARNLGTGSLTER